MFRHPVTNQPLGHTEQVLGTLVLTAVEPGAATGRLVPLAGRAAPAPAPRRWRADHRRAAPRRGAPDQRGAGRLRQRRPDPAPAGGAVLRDSRQDRTVPVGRSSAGPGPGGPGAGIEPLAPRGGPPARRGGRAQLPAGPRWDDPRSRDHVDLRTDRRDARGRPLAADADELPAALCVGGDPGARAPVSPGWTGSRARARRPRRRRACGAGRGRRAECDRLPDDRGRQPGTRGRRQLPRGRRTDPVRGRGPGDGYRPSPARRRGSAGRAAVWVSGRACWSGGRRADSGCSTRRPAGTCGWCGWGPRTGSSSRTPGTPSCSRPRSAACCGTGSASGTPRVCACRGASASMASP